MLFKPKQFYKLHYILYTPTYKVTTKYETLIIARSPAKATAILEKKLKKRGYKGRYQIIHVNNCSN